MSDKEFDPHLNIEPIAKSRDTNYLLREIEIEHSKLKIDTPYKIIEGKNIKKDSYDLIGGNIKKPIFESWAYVTKFDQFNRLKYLLEEAQEDNIPGLDSFFGLRKSIWNRSPTTLSLVFSKNPFVENVFFREKKKIKLRPLDQDCYEYRLLDYIHSASRELILSPDIRIKRMKNKQLNIKLEEYIKFVDNNIKILSDFNKRPIFAPIQIHLNQRNLKKILGHYKEQNYTNIWINFNASHIGGTYFSRVRTLIRLIDDIIGLNNVVLYYSHIKKEINPHPKDEKVVASDILSQFFAAGFIGISRNPQRASNETQDEREERIKNLITKGDYTSMKDFNQQSSLNRRRMFDPETYYYYKLDSYPTNLLITQHTLLKREINQLYNSVLLYSEVENTKDFVLKQNKSKNEKVLLSYIKNKKAVEDHGEILEGIVPTAGKKQVEQKGLFEFLGEQ